MIIIIFALIIVLAISLFTVILYVHKLQQQVTLLDKEQHIQNNEIIELMKSKMQHQEMLLTHIEVLKYLVDQDPKLNAGKIYYSGPIGEA
jgi:Na+-transporting NADH:ubiquinone oxidoreductase subunit NqrC